MTKEPSAINTDIENFPKHDIDGLHNGRCYIPIYKPSAKNDIEDPVVL